MITRLILIAHAETRGAREGRFTRDDSVSPRGLEAARALRKSLPRHDRVVTSPAPAARETAASLGLAASIDTALRGLDLGAWTGRSLPEIAGDDPDGAAAWIGDPDYAGHGGDSVGSLVERTAVWLQSMRDEGRTLLAISHAPNLRAAVVSVLAAEPAAFWRVDVTPLTMLTLTSDGRRWMMRGLTESG